jgi:protein phosphatase
VAGKRIISTRLTGGSVTVREENAIAALEVMSRFAVDPRWLIYLPPTMSPTTTSSQPGVLEHPQDAFDAYRTAKVAELVCQEKHMGSRAVVIACCEPEVARARFGLDEPAAGVIYTRTGRAFFADQRTEHELLDRVSAAIGVAGLWQALDTDWVALDCELLPWSAKATELLRTQYAPVGAAAGAVLAAADTLVGAAARAGLEVGELRARTQARLAMAGQFRDAYRRYCWPVGSVADLKLAPFQVLASAGKVHALRPHGWHLQMADLLAAADPRTFRQTSRIGVLTGEAATEAAATSWWEALTSAGGEGMVVKPAGTVSLTDAGLAQPGIKCRGPEYLRIIYGPEYNVEANLARLRTRSVGHKRALALREYALGIEALERFAAAEPLHRVHECVFGVLALECEPVDPRL